MAEDQDHVRRGCGYVEIEREPASQGRRLGSRTATISPGGVITVGGIVSTLAQANAPWWGTALVATLIAIISAGLVAMHLLLPQESSDRLQWWRDFRQTRARRQASGTQALCRQRARYL
jgi:hypothetical protein